MMRSLFSGVAGLKTHQTKMDVIGNNIANVNTVGYKSQSVTFQDLMYQTTQNASGANGETGRGGINAKQIGLGVSTGAISTAITTSGASQSTGNPFDIQISGDSFFVVSDGQDNFFTRAGAFYVDGVGNLAMTSNGYTVMGWQPDPENPSNIIKDTVTPLKIMSAENLVSQPEQTLSAYMSGVIDKNSTQLSSSEGLIVNVSVYDNLGYGYIAKTSIKSIDGVDGIYTIEPTELLASNAVDTDKDDGYTENGRQLQDNAALKMINSETDDASKKAHQGIANATASDIYIGLGGTKVYGISWRDKDDVNKIHTMVVDPSKEYKDEDGNVIDIKAQWGLDNDTIKSTNTYIIYDPTNGKYVGYATGASAPVGPDGDGKYHIGSDEVELNPESPLGLNVYGIDGFSQYNEESGNNVDIRLETTTRFDNNKTSTIKGTAGDYAGNWAGRKVGEMSGVSIQQDGKIYASYSNGTTKLLGQIAVATFANPSGLEKEGENLYSATLNSGAFDGIGVDVTAASGSLSTGVLEMSNVDLSTEFTDMITTQRGFQANSRIITVSDSMIEELTNLKR